MQTIKILTELQLVAFGGLALVSYRAWRARRGKAAGWVAAAFGIVAVVIVVGHQFPQNLNQHPDLFWPAKGLLAILMLFPYCLYRFMASLKPQRPWLHQAGPTMTGIVIGATLALPYFPQPGHRPAWFELYTLALVAQWTVLVATVAVGLWNAARGEPAIARRRLRLLALGSTGMAIIILLAGASPVGARQGIAIGTQSLSLVAAALFGLGFAPPRFLRKSWLQHEEEAFRGAVARLMTARTVEEVAEVLIPAITSMVCGQAAALTDSRGRLIASYGLNGSLEYELEAMTTIGDSLRDGEIRPGLIAMGLRSGSLLIWASAFTPYFGTDDMSFLRYLADLADLALERCELFARERSFIANASHELRTPLTTIAGMAGILTDTWRQMNLETIEDCLDAINRQSVRVRDLVQNLLDLSHIENVTPAVALRAVSLAEAGRSALEAAPPPSGSSVELEVGEGVAALADVRGLERALTNLLVNAYRYGGPRVRVEARTLEREVLLTVTDNGEGVPADLVPNLFDPFTRGPATGGISGSGLGLAITRELVEGFGGRIGYEAARPSGARFALHLRKPVA
ncbi:MAG TPA: ATP-binding protein [Actinomycetota bacterium]|nr:ATP-binding protein [Actinomycetota bacterium]